MKWLITHQAPTSLVHPFSGNREGHIAILKELYQKEKGGKRDGGPSRGFHQSCFALMEGGCGGGGGMGREGEGEYTKVSTETKS